jgi:hypothetical protein
MEDTPTNLDSNTPNWLLRLRNIALIIIGLLTAWNTYRTDVANKKLDIQAKQLDQTIREREFANGLRFKVFEEVKNALNDTNGKMQEVVKVMVEQMLVDDSSFQQKMISVLLASRSIKESVKNDVEQTQLYEEEEDNIAHSEALHQITQDAASFGKYRVDVFYLEDQLPNSKGKAELAVKELKQKYPNFIIKLRLLPQSINARESYRIDGLEMRYEKEEYQIAKEINQYLQAKNVFNGAALEMNMIQYHTPAYISIFVGAN